MNAEELKHNLRELFGQQIAFNSDFDSYVQIIGNMDSNLLDWCLMVKEGKIRYAPARKINGIIFIKKIGSSNRCIVIKIVNGEFKEVHLGDHNYYDKLRKVLGLKKDNKYY
ncbi:MAG: hypothetical protein KKC75_07920 [Nanoarchaeota archaeon]|nr:hypothetical protein [Nanoarchaeota archaeon]MBU1005171.1 hypothetical protein [Nanoarchaeota archaeon]MBU1946846.1 hypothetical protein [Nanoarchaeota archaeon]